MTSLSSICCIKIYSWLGVKAKRTVVRNCGNSGTLGFRDRSNNKARELFLEIKDYRDADGCLNSLILRPTENKKGEKYLYDASGNYTGQTFTNALGQNKVRSAPRVEYEGGCIVKKIEEGYTTIYKYDQNKYIISEETTSPSSDYKTVTNIEYIFDEKGRIVQRTVINTGDHLHDVLTYKYKYSGNGEVVEIDYDLNGRKGEPRKYQIEGRKVVKRLDDIVYNYIWCPDYDPNIITYPEAFFSLGYF